MNCNACNNGGYAQNYNGGYYGTDGNYGMSQGYSNGGNLNGAGGRNTGCGCGNCRRCDLYWQGYMAGFYANNSCNRSAEARSAAQAAGCAAAASSGRGCACNTCNTCN